MCTRHGRFTCIISFIPPATWESRYHYHHDTLIMIIIMIIIMIFIWLSLQSKKSEHGEVQKHAAGHSAPRWSGWNAGRSTAEPHLLSVDRRASRLVTPQLTWFPFLCRGADEEEDTWRPALPGGHPLPLCAWQRVCSGFWPPWRPPGKQRASARSVPQTHSGHRALRGMASFTVTDCAAHSLVVVGKGQVPRAQPGAVTGSFRSFPNSCFELPQESQPL